MQLNKPFLRIQNNSMNKIPIIWNLFFVILKDISLKISYSKKYFINYTNLL